MKKTLINAYYKQICCSKIFKIMRNTLLLLMLNVFHIFAVNSYPQSTMLSINLRDATLKEVLSQIEAQSEFFFLYNSKLIDINRKTNLSVKDQKIDNILSQLFDNTEISYVVFDRQIILSAKEYINSLKAEAFQPQPVTGTVNDKNGDPLIGVTVMVKGTTLGTITDVQGNFSLANVPEDGVLVFSFVGMRTQEIPVEGRTVFTLMMEEDIIGMEEIVVVGYGTQKKENLTGSVDVVSAEKLANRSAPNMSFLLQGAAPNLNFKMSGNVNEPGASGTFNIRGVGSISGNDAPLILVDGVPMNINNIDPESVESISVLKDASASAIYGSRAPFGVVLITTKKGGVGIGPRVQYDNNMALKHPINIPHFYDALTWATAYNQARANSGVGPVYPAEQVDRITAYMNGSYPNEYNVDSPPQNLWRGRWEGNANYDWPHEYYKNLVWTQKHNISIYGGDEKSQYYILGGVLNDDGVYKYGYDFYKRYNAIANFSTKVTDWLGFNFGSKFTQSLTDHPLGTTVNDRSRWFREIITFGPMTPKYNVNGSIQNPLIRLMEDTGRDKTKSNDLLLTFGGELNPLEGLKMNVSYNFRLTTLDNVQNPKPVWVELATGAFGNIGKKSASFETRTASTLFHLFNVVTSYEKSLNDHFFKVLVGYEQELNSYKSLYGKRESLITPEVPSISTALGTTTLDDSMNHWATEGVFGRLNYNYKEKYLLEFSARYNGSSRFAKENRWGFFPSASAGYTISKEEFWSGIRPYVNRLKIRGSYGSLGNQNVNNYLYLSRMLIQPDFNRIIDDALPLYTAAPSLISEDLTWETITTLNFGLDAGFLDNRLDLVFDWYNRKTTDMIGPSLTLPSLLGTSAPQRNNAELETKGLEITVGWRDRISTDFSYNAQISLGDSRTTILKYTNDKGLIDTWYAGKEYGEVWGFITDGIIQTDEELADMPDQSKYYSQWTVGDMKYKDLTDDDIINDGQRTIDDHGDLTVIGNISPRYNIGITAGFTWKGFDFNMFWQGIGKNNYFPTANNVPIFFGMDRLTGSSAVLKGSPVLDYWRPADETNILGPNTDAYFAKPYFSWETAKNRLTQSRFALNAAYLRLKNLQLGYTIPQNLSNRVYIQKARIYFSGENLLTFKHLPKIIDPETVFARNFVGAHYPLSSMFSVGVNLTF